MGGGGKGVAVLPIGVHEYVAALHVLVLGLYVNGSVAKGGGYVCCVDRETRQMKYLACIEA